MPIVTRTPDFNKCVRELKRYRHIKKDISTFIQALSGYLKDKQLIPRTHVITGLGEGFYPVYKVEKFHSSDLKDNTRMRVIYTYNPIKDEVILIEIYFKGKRKNHDEAVIKKYLIKKSN